MTKTLTNREAQPIVLENPKKVGVFVQQGDAVDFYNMFDASIIVGEPFIMYNKVAVTKVVVPPLSMGTANFGAWMKFLVDPALAAAILFGEKVYYDLDLADSDVPGYATNVEPTNGFVLGYATPSHGQVGQITLDDTTGKPVCAAVGATYVGVKMSEEEIVWGTNLFGQVPDYINGDDTISS